MRITNKMITTKYIRSLGNLSSDLDKLNTQVASGRKFSKASENTSATIKAFQIRRDLSKVEGYQSNINHAKDFLTNAESALLHMEELMKTTSEKILFGMNGTQSQEERKIVATDLRNIQDQLLQSLNSSSSNIYYFGGTNTNTKPFTLDVNGKLQYNNVLLDDSSSLTPEQQTKLTSDSLYVDIGLNIQFNGSGIDKSTVFHYSTAGINIVGSGTTNVNGEDLSNNLYDLIGQIASAFEKDDYSFEKMDAYFGNFQKSSGNIVKAITDIGSKTAYLDFMTERLGTQTLNMQERQLSVEGADPTSTIIKFKSQEVAYNAALQMGTKIIQPSIFDFMS